MPFAGSVIPGLLIARGAASIGASAIVGAPVLLDVFEKSTRGKALALGSGTAGICTLLVSVGALRLAAAGIPLFWLFLCPSVICLISAVFLFFAIKNPNL